MCLCPSCVPGAALLHHHFASPSLSHAHAHTPSLSLSTGGPSDGFTRAVVQQVSEAGPACEGGVFRPQGQRSLFFLLSAASHAFPPLSPTPSSTQQQEGGFDAANYGFFGDMQLPNEDLGGALEVRACVCMMFSRCALMAA